MKIGPPEESARAPEYAARATKVTDINNFEALGLSKYGFDVAELTIINSTPPVVTDARDRLIKELWDVIEAIAGPDPGLAYSASVQLNGIRKLCRDTLTAHGRKIPTT